MPSEQTPPLSVLMPVYNGARYLRLAVDSILAQTWGRFEFVVVDDGSTDETPSILAGYDDERLRVVRTEHGGLIAALNTGLELCRAALIARMDADDVSYVRRLERQMAWMDRHEGVAVVACRADRLDDAGRVIGSHPEFDPEDMLLELASGNPIVHGSVLMRRALLPPRPVYRRAPEDYALWVELVRAGRQFGCLPETLYGFREHGGRYSLARAEQQSAANVGVQRPLLERCERSRDLRQPAVRAKLIRGWGIMAGAAYRAGLAAEAEMARRRFLKLAEAPWTGPVQAAAEHGIQAMVWGGCPWHRACTLLWLWLRRGRWQHHGHRQLASMLPGLKLLRDRKRRLEGRARRRPAAGSRADPHPPP